MSRYIDADEFKRINKRLLHCDFPYLCELTLEELLDEMPTVDAVPVIHAEWEDDYPLYHCTNCRHTIMCHDRMDLAEYHRYCGRCGAMMSM